jgi:hypothetical protein
MKKLRDYLEHQQQVQNRPVTGDLFAFNLREEVLLESEIIEHDHDSITLLADDTVLELLEAIGAFEDKMIDVDGTEVDQYDYDTEEEVAEVAPAKKLVTDYDSWLDQVKSMGADTHLGKNQVHVVAQTWDGDIVGEFHLGRNQGYIVPRTMEENLRNWFKQKWVRFGPDGKIRGDCARGDDSEGKPKCLPQAKAHALGKKGRASAASRKRREDPNPERSGKAINVATKKTNEEQLDERCWDGYEQQGMKKKGDRMVPNCVPVSEQACPHCGGPMYEDEALAEKQDACYHKVRSRYKVWPSAYASGALVQCRKKGAKNWGNKSNEDLEEMNRIRKLSGISDMAENCDCEEPNIADQGEYDYEGDMAKDDLQTIVRAARRLTGMLDDNENMPEWVQSKINKAADYVDTAADYIESNLARELEEVDMDEAKYQGREVQLNKPTAGDVKKFKVYVKDPTTGNVKKVNFGDKTMRIKKSNPARRRSFRARHRCENPGPKTKARYWSCRKW